MNIFKMFFVGMVTIIKFIYSFFKYFFIGLITLIIIIPKYFIIGIMYIFNRDKRIKSNKGQRKLSLIMLALSFSVYLICVFLVSKWSVQGLKIRYLSNDIMKSTEIIEKEDKNYNDNLINDTDSNTNNDNEQNGNSNTSNFNKSNIYYPNDYWDYMSIPFMEVDFNELLKKNSDTVGWIKVDGTKVNYPVVQYDDNNYYLNHAFNKTDNISGWIFADYRNDFSDFGRNTIIYGHNMNNKTMFGSIPSMLSSSYLNNSNNNYIKLSTPNTNTIWKVFSIYIIEPEVYYIKTNFYNENFGNWLNTMKERSVYDFGVDVDENDKVLTLSTCDNTGTKRIAVHAKMINIEYK